MTPLELLEEKLAHTTRLAEDLSDVVAAQAKRIDLLEAQVSRLTEFARDATQDGGGAITLTDRPPHY